MNKKNENSNRSFIPKTIGESIQKVNHKFSYKFGKIEYLIHAKWGQIVGTFFANHSEPLKISSAQNYISDSNETVLSNFLHVNVSPAAAVEFQHFKDKIIEKINSYFGYKAIIGLKIHQNFISKVDHKRLNKKNYKQNTKMYNKKVEQQTQGFKNKDLKESVVKLGLSISKEEQ